MNEEARTAGGYVGYEYKEVAVVAELASLYRNSYPCFGWQEDPNAQPPRAPALPQSAGRARRQALQFRRERKLCNRVELTRLQRHFDGCVAEIEALERSKTSLPTLWALAVALAGTVFLALATFAVVGTQPNYPLSALLAVPGFLGWILPVFLYRELVRRRTKKLAPLIEAQYDMIDQICEKGSRLLL